MAERKLAVHFKTFGPFPIKRDIGTVSIEEFWETVKGKTKDLLHPRESLEFAVGVYIFVEKRGSSHLPWYVGKTDVGFRKRFNQHASDKGNLPKFLDELSKDDMEVFLIARLNQSGRLSNKVSTKRKTIDRLEFALIGSCLSQNSELKNKSQVTFHAGLTVPGYLNDSVPERDIAAKKLARMLKSK